MTELQLGLIALGGVGVAGVFAYNKWQEYRHRKLAEQVLRRDHEDVLMPRRGPASVIPEDEDDLPEVQRVRPAEPAFEPADEPYETAVPAAREVPDTPRERASVALDQPDFRSIRERVEPEIRMEPSLADERVEPVLGDVVDAPVAPAEPRYAAPPAPVSAIAAAPVAAPNSADIDNPPWEDPVVETRSVAAPNTMATSEPPRTADAPATADAMPVVPAILVSPAIDYIASFDLIEEVYGDQLLRSQSEVLARVTKPINWAGYNEKTREWERVVVDGRYRCLRIGLQLADRRGALGEADLLTFHGAMAALAEELMAVAEMPDYQAALNAAVSLDQFCANVDIQIGMNLVSQGQTFPGTKIRALAEAAGMQLEGGGIFVRRDDDGHVLYTLHNQESTAFAADTMRNLTTHGLVFLMDVPCVSHGDRVFAQMLDVARRMADTLHGVLVDDNRKPLTEASMDPFRRQIGQYQAQLAAKGLPAGSPLTLRLFA